MFLFYSQVATFLQYKQQTLSYPPRELVIFSSCNLFYKKHFSRLPKPIFNQFSKLSPRLHITTIKILLISSPIISFCIRNYLLSYYPQTSYHKLTFPSNKFLIIADSLLAICSQYTLTLSVDVSLLQVHFP